MATALTPTAVTHKALVPIGTASAGDTAGNTVPNSGGHSFLYVEAGSTARTITVAFARTVDDQAVTARTLNVPANFKGFLKLGSVADYGAIVSVTPSNADVLLKLFELA